MILIQYDIITCCEVTGVAAAPKSSERAPFTISSITAILKEKMRSVCQFQILREII